MRRLGLSPQGLLTLQLAAVLITVELHWPLFQDQLGGLRWLFTFAVFAPTYLWATRSPRLRTAMTRLPLSGLAAWAIWALISANWSSSLPLAFGLSFGMVSTIVVGALYAGTYGWPRFARTVAVTIAVFLTAGAVYRLGEGVVGGNGRFEGLAHGPTDAGRLGVILAATSMSGFVDRPAARYGLAALGCVTIYGAGARAATIGLVLGAILVLFRRLPRNGLRPAAAVIGLAGLILLSFVALSGGASIDFASREDEPEELSSLTGRTEVWSEALNASSERPFVGHGLASSQSIFDQLATDGILSWDPGTSHNLWLNNQLQLGLIGTMLLVLALGGIVWNTGRQPDPYRDALLLAILINSFTEPLLHEPAAVLLVLAGMAGALSFRPVPDRADNADPVVDRSRPEGDDRIGVTASEPVTS